jgi:DNA polymerase-3 subunit epsilon
MPRKPKAMSDIILFDTETTGLLLPAGSPLENQPRILEFAAIKLNKDLEEIGRLEFMCNPGTGVPPIITKITGITNADIDGKPPFSENLKSLQEFHTGVKYQVAHNVSFDCGMLRNELLRLEADALFPWPAVKICTVEATHYIKNRRMKLEKVYEHFFNKPAEQKHRAMGDVEILTAIFIELVKTGVIEL